jgi:hypothetical protein
MITLETESAMAIVIDEQAHKAIQRRWTHYKDASIGLHVTPILHGGHTVSVDWEHGTEGYGESSRHVIDGAVVDVDARVDRYARWHDVVISAAHIGPLDVLFLKDPALLLQIAQWERLHPSVAA